eukprot:Platyproteum_vivax@DN7636_c0_g1_i12.p1
MNTFVTKDGDLVIKTKLKNPDSNGASETKWNLHIMLDDAKTHMTSVALESSQIVDAVGGSVQTTNNLVGASASHKFSLSTTSKIVDSSEMTLTVAGFTFPPNCAPNPTSPIKSCVGSVGSAVVTLEQIVGTFKFSIDGITNPATANLGELYTVLSVKNSAQVLKQHGGVLNQNVADKGEISVTPLQKISAANVGLGRKSQYLFNLTTSTGFIKGAFLVLKCTSHTVDYTGCNTDLEFGESCVSTPHGMKVTLRNFAVTNENQGKFTLATTLVNPTNKGNVESVWTAKGFLSDGSTATHENPADLKGPTYLPVGDLTGPVTSNNLAITYAGLYTFTFGKTGAAITANSVMTIKAEKFDFSKCSTRLSGAKSCTGVLGKVKLTMDAVSASTFVVKLTVINPAKVITDPQFEVFVKSAAGVITHDGTLTGQSLVTTPFLKGVVHYQSLESETSDIFFDIFPEVANFDNVGLFHVEALTSGYSLSATQSFGQLGSKAKLSTVSGSDVKVVEKVEKVQKVYVDKVHVESGKTYSVKMRVTKPGVASGAGEFRVALQTLSGGTLTDEEASNMTGPLLTVANKVKDTAISVGSKKP